MIPRNFFNVENLSADTIINNKKNFCIEMEFKAILLISIGSIFNHLMLLMNKSDDFQQIYRLMEISCFGMEVLILIISFLLKYTKVVKNIKMLNTFLLLSSLLSQSMLIYTLLQTFSATYFSYQIQLVMITQAFTIFLFPNFTVKILAIIFIIFSSSITIACDTNYTNYINYTIYTIQTITIFMIIMGVIYLINKRNNMIFEYFSNDIYDDMLSKKILRAFPESVLIINQNSKLMYSNNPFKLLIDARFPKQEHYESFFHNIKNLRLRGGYGSLINSSCDEREFENVNIDSSSPLKKILCQDHSFLKEITLLEIVQYIIDIIKESQTMVSCLIIQGNHEDKELEIKIISLTYEKNPSLLFFISDITLQNLKTKFEDNTKYKSLLLSSVSHELKTPLHGGISMIQTSIDEPTISQKTKGELLIPALSCLKLLLSSINDILDYSQILSDTIILNFKSANLFEVTNDVLELMQFQAKRKTNIDLIVDIDKNIPKSFITDSARFSQILLILLGNAYKFTFSGKIELNLRYKKFSDAIKISIKDTGIGISQESVSRLKILFKLAGNHYSSEKIADNSTGCALGLLIASNLIKYLKPDNDSLSFNLKSVEGVGSKFTFYIKNKKFIPILNNIDLIKTIRSKSTTFIDKDIDFLICNHRKLTSDILIPKLNDNDVINIVTNNSINFEDVDPFTIAEKLNLSFPNKFLDQYKTRDVCHKSSFKSKNIIPLKNDVDQEKSQLFYKKIVMIVDDDFFNIYSMQMMLNSLNIQHLAANNGKNAVDLIINSSSHVELIFMDCNMPVMDGFEATKILREMMTNGTIKYIPIVGCTAYCDKENIAKCLEYGMNEVVSKPMMKKILIDKLEKYALIRD